jgi:hypothetical protein
VVAKQWAGAHYQSLLTTSEDGTFCGNQVAASVFRRDRVLLDVSATERAVEHKIGGEMYERNAGSRTNLCDTFGIRDCCVAGFAVAAFVQSAKKPRIEMDHCPCTVDTDLILRMIILELNDGAGKPTFRASIPEQLGERQIARGEYRNGHTAFANLPAFDAMFDIGAIVAPPPTVRVENRMGELPIFRQRPRSAREGGSTGFQTADIERARLIMSLTGNKKRAPVD